MNLKFNKAEITDQFLNPISKVATDCSITVTNQHIQSLVTDSNGTVILYSKLKTPNPDIAEDEVVNLNIKEIRKLIRVFDCINSESFDLEVDENASTLKFKSKEMSFKLHLVLDEAIKKCSLSLEKISKLTFNTEFTLLGSKLSEVLKGSTFATETNKIYFYTKDGIVYAELTDKASEQLDSITFNIADKFTGDALNNALPFSLEVLRLLAGAKDSINVKINNTYRIIMFEINNQNGLVKYIIPAYVK